MAQANVVEIMDKLEEAAQYLSDKQMAYLLGYGEGVIDSNKGKDIKED